MRIAALGVVVVLGCSSEEAPPESSEGGAGGAPSGCAPGELAQDGACVPAGVPPEGCGTGFEPDGQGGCVAVVPSEPCADGLMALPGETRCREIMPCGAAPWGDIETDGTTEFVDGSFSGVSDGSAAAPWITIQAGIDNAAPGAVVAVAAGTYTEILEIDGKAIELRGRCPSLVKVVAPDRALTFFSAADGSVVSGLALSGASLGITVFEGQSIRLEKLRVHDTARDGMQVGSPVASAGVALVDSLVERATQTGLLVAGSELALERSVVRETQLAEGGFGRGLVALATAIRRSRIEVRSAWFEQNHEYGINVAGSDGDVEGTLVRNTMADLVTGRARGIFATEDTMTREPAIVLVRSSVIEGSEGGGVLLSGATGTFESLVIRNSLPEPVDGTFGRGLSGERGPVVGAPCTFTMAQSLIEWSHDVGVALAGAEGTLSGVIVRDTQTRFQTDRVGYGVSARDYEGSDVRSNLTVEGSVVVRNHGLGIFVGGSDATVAHTLVADTLPQSPATGTARGIHVQQQDDTLQRGHLTLRKSAVERSGEAGILIVDSDATVETSSVLDTQADAEGLFGDGIVVWAYEENASITATGMHVARAARAGIVSFGAGVQLRASTLECNAIELVHQAWSMFAGELEDLGDNLCGCDGLGACKAEQADIAPPSPIVD